MPADFGPGDVPQREEPLPHTAPAPNVPSPAPRQQPSTKAIAWVAGIFVVLVLLSLSGGGAGLMAFLLIGIAVCVGGLWLVAQMMRNAHASGRAEADRKHQP
jgi:predicted lipid-binding transport protein (Tim44 family)